MVKPTSSKGLKTTFAKVLERKANSLRYNMFCCSQTDTQMRKKKQQKKHIWTYCSFIIAFFLMWMYKQSQNFTIFHSLGRQYPLPCIVVQTKIFSGIISASISCFNTLINEQTSLKKKKKRGGNFILDNTKETVNIRVLKLKSYISFNTLYYRLLDLSAWT